MSVPPKALGAVVGIILAGAAWGFWSARVKRAQERALQRISEGRERAEDATCRAAPAMDQSRD